VKRSVEPVEGLPEQPRSMNEKVPKWETKRDGGRQGEMGAQSVLQPWFDGRPSSFGSTRLVQTTASEVSKLQHVPPLLTFSNLAKTTRLHRRHHDSENGLSTIWTDTFVSTSNDSRPTTVNYVTTFKSPVIAIYDALGRDYTWDTLPTTSEVFGGALAFVLEGEHQPATLLAFHHGNAPLAPTIRRMGPTALSLDFAIHLDPARPVTLLLGACQRPLQAFISAADAFSDWLPLTLPPPLQSVAPIPTVTEAMNYQLPPK